MPKEARTSGRSVPLSSRTCFSRHRGLMAFSGCWQISWTGQIPLWGRGLPSGGFAPPGASGNRPGAGPGCFCRSRWGAKSPKALSTVHPRLKSSRIQGLFPLYRKDTWFASSRMVAPHFSAPHRLHGRDRLFTFRRPVGTAGAKKTALGEASRIGLKARNGLEPMLGQGAPKRLTVRMAQGLRPTAKSRRRGGLHGGSLRRKRQSGRRCGKPGQCRG